MHDWRSLALGSLSVATGLLVWYLIGALNLVSTDLLAGPADVWAALVDILRNGYRDTTLAQNILATLGRCLAGFGAAAMVGVPLGLWMGLSRMADAAINFVIQFLAAPSASILSGAADSVVRRRRPVEDCAAVHGRLSHHHDGRHGRRAPGQRPAHPGGALARRHPAPGAFLRRVPGVLVDDLHWLAHRAPPERFPRSSPPN